MLPKAALSPSQHIQWILDFDGTITKHDTLDALVDIAAVNKPGFPVLEHWKRVIQAYLDDYRATLEKLVPGGVDPKSIEEERQLLKDLRPVEQRSLDRIHKSGIFENLTKKQMDDGAKRAVASGQVEFRPNLSAIFRHAESFRGKVNILSVNWSRRFISASLKAAGIDLDLHSILSNELEGIEQGRPSTGLIVPTSDTMTISSSDKLHLLENIRRLNETSGKPLPIVYVGDSWTDLECLLAADLGICIRDDSASHSQKQLAASLERMNIQCPHLADWTNCDEWKIVWAEDIVDVEHWIRSTVVL